jgi:alkyl hydroperoxide reductase subunit AhpC
LGDIHRDVVKRYGIHWPELNACHRATVVIDRRGVVRFIERYGRGELPDPVKILAEVKKLD